MKGVIVTGGTGGHIFPAISAGRAFERAGHTVEFVVVGNKIGKLNIPQHTTRYFSGNSPFSGSIPSRVKNSIRMFLLFLKGLSMFKDTDFVIGTGSYASFSFLLSAKTRGVPVYMLEQNTIPGRVTRFFSNRQVTTFISFPNSKKYLSGPSVFTGNPIREEAKIQLSKEEACRRLGIRKSDNIVLVLGGSLGAYHFARKVLELASGFSDLLYIVQTGKHHEKLKIAFGERGNNHYLIDFHSKPGVLYSASDYVIARAGAGTIYELSFHAKPSIFVPFPYAQDNHQYYNALYVKEHEGGLLLEENELNRENLKSALNMLIQNRKHFAVNLNKMFPHDAEQRILKEIENDMGKV